MNSDTLFIGNVNPVYHYFGKSVLLFHSKLVPPVQRFKQRLCVDFLYLAFYHLFRLTAGGSPPLAEHILRLFQ